MLSDYLTGSPPARSFLERHADDPWGVPAVVLYESGMGAMSGHLDADVMAIHRAVEAAMDVLPVTAETVAAALSLQGRLHDDGRPLSGTDALIAATAAEHGATLATADRLLCGEAVGGLVDVVAYEPG